VDAGGDVTTRSLERAADHHELATRKPLPFWDRIKIVLLASALFGLFVWNDVASNPILPLRDSLNRQLDARWWLLAVVAIELLRQGHYLLSEVSAGWHRFWFHKVFGGLNRRTAKMNDWTRYRIGRVIRIVILLVVLDLILAALFDLSPSNALVEAPARLFDYLPLFLQLVFAFFFVIIQMVGLFWFLSRGGVDTYMPDDIDTRFSDVWGQDNVVERVKENIVFLEDPESIEAKGGYVPSGLLLWGPPGTGKGQPVSSFVMTPSGPRTMGSIVPGDEVIGSDGTPTRVLEVHLLGERDLFRVSFSDGRSLLVTEDHLWQVSTGYGGTHVKSTADLVGRLYEAGNKTRYRIPMVAPVQFAERELPLHPYLLGALLGDGTFRHQVGFSNADLDVLARVELLLPEGDGLVRKSEYDWSIIGGTTRTVLKELELFGHYSYEKWIPEEYLYSSAEQRLHLLQGLMDTDGNVDARGVIEYHSTSHQLVEGVRSLVESFGGTVTLTTRDTRYRHNGQSLRGRPIHVLRMALPTDLVPVLVERKAERVKPRTKYFPSRRIVSIEPDGREEARCIKVDAPDHLYVAEHYIVTHNTLMAEAVAGETGKPYVFVDPGAFAQPLDALVATPAGWRKMGDLSVGDDVIGRDGRATRVNGVFPQGEREIFRVTFSDGASTRVTADHLWAVQSPWQRESGKDRWQLKRTADLGRLRKSHKGGWQWSIPMVQPVEWDAKPVPLDPYVLGALLGDGCVTGTSILFVNTDERIVDRVRDRLPRGVTLAGEGPRYRLTGVDARGRSIVRNALIDLGADRVLAHDKRVPELYLQNSVVVRLETLRGLLDTDGCVTATASGGSHTSFCTTSIGLCDDVVELVRSLGGIASVTTNRFEHRRDTHTVNVYLPDDVIPVAVKDDQLAPRSRPVRRYIASIEPDGVELAQCIRVDADDHLYVTDDYIVTHNTAMFMGVGIMKVKSLFKKLRKLALRYGGVIVFFDEADSLGNRGQLAGGGGQGGGFATPKPFVDKPSCNGLSYLTPESQSAIIRDGFIMGGMGGGGGMGTLQALLSEISGLKKPRGFLNRHGRRLLGMKPKPPPKYRILIMMATNMPQALDEALLRPGRIDRIYKVGYPSKAGRIRTYEGYFAKVEHNLGPDDLDKLATITPYATGATIKDLVNESLITAIRDGRDVIEWRDVIKAKQLKDLGPPEDVEYIERERHAVAIHEACHAVAAYKVRKHLTIDIATIEKGGNYLGMVASIPPEDQFTRWRTEYEADIMVSLASLAGERMFFEGDNSSGVSGDLESATFLATYMEGFWGMGETVSSHGVTHRVGVGGGGKPGAPEAGKDRERNWLEGSLGSRIEAKLGELLERTEQLLVENRRHVLAVAHALETTKTVTGDDVEAIIEGTRGPLLDGRMYHEPEFLELAERYHRDAVVAHQGHDKPVLTLPQPSVWYHADDEESERSNGHHPVASGADVARSDAPDED
jgi:ATP-dependent Zn protease